MPPEELAVILSTQDFILSELEPKIVDSIVAWFRNWKRYRELADEFLWQHQWGMAINLIWALLQKNIPPQEFDKLVQGRGPETQIEQWIWIHGQTRKEKQEAWKAGAGASGGIPYEEWELLRLQELMADQEYRSWSRFNAEKIAAVLNWEFHKKALEAWVVIRTSENVRQKISRLKAKTKKRVGELLSWK
jgi:hypothetical protein